MSFPGHCFEGTKYSTKFGWQKKDWTCPGNLQIMSQVGKGDLGRHKSGGLTQNSQQKYKTHLYLCIKCNPFISSMLVQGKHKERHPYTEGLWLLSHILEPDWALCSDLLSWWKVNPPENPHFRLDSVYSKLGIESWELQKHRKQTLAQLPGEFKLSNVREAFVWVSLWHWPRLVDSGDQIKIRRNGGNSKVPLRVWYKEK